MLKRKKPLLRFFKREKTLKFSTATAFSFKDFGSHSVGLDGWLFGLAFGWFFQWFGPGWFFLRIGSFVFLSDRISEFLRDAYKDSSVFIGSDTIMYVRWISSDLFSWFFLSSGAFGCGSLSLAAVLSNRWRRVCNLGIKLLIINNLQTPDGRQEKTGGDSPYIYSMRKLPYLLLFVIIPFAAISKPIRVGIAGMTHAHVGQVFGYIGTQDEVVIVGFAEPNKELAMRLLHQHHLPDSLWFPTLEALIKKTNPDAVCAFNSIFEHLAVVKICAPKGIHVMVEKPLAVNNDHLAQMMALVKQYHIQLLTNFETTWYPSHAKAWDMVKTEKSLGTIRKMVIMDGHQGPKEIGCPKEFLDWLTDPVMNGGGALIDFGCYGADLMTWFMDGQAPVSVTAVKQQFKPEEYPKVEDEATIILTYPTCQAIIQASWNWTLGRKDTEIYGTQGILVANKEMKMKYTPAVEPGKETWLDLTALPHERSNPFAYLAAVVNGKIDPGKDLSSLPVNEVVVHILAAATESANTGKTVMLGNQ